MIFSIFIGVVMSGLTQAAPESVELRLQSGAYEAELESRFAWTLHKFKYENNPLLVGSGWMGTVIKCKVPKGKDPFIGTGHGGEVVKSLEIFVDGKPLKLAGKASQLIKGDYIKVVKQSQIGPLAHSSEITLSSKGLEQSFDFVVNKDASSLVNMYLFMSIWEKSMDQWLSAPVGGKVVKGSFKHNNKFIQTGKVDWVALFNPENGLAGICVYQLPEKHKSFFWDRAVDNKHYIKYYPQKKRGSKFSCKSFIATFKTTSADFEKDAKSKAEIIKKDFFTQKKTGNERLIGGQSKSMAYALEKQIMKNIKGPLPFKIIYPDAVGKVVSAKDFGLSENGTAKANAIALQKAIDYCKSNDIRKLIVPKGKYRLLKSTVDARDRNGRKTHHSNRIFTVNLIGMKNFVFDGQGAEFIFEDLDMPRGREILGGFFRVLGCERVQLKNFTIDWDWNRTPLGFVGKIVKVDRKNLTVDYQVSYNKKPIPNDIHVYAVRGWDPKINNRTNNSFEFYWKIAKSHKMIGPNTLRFTFKNSAQIRRAKVGMWAIFKAKTHFFAAGFITDENRNISFENITIYGVPSSGMWARRNKFLEIMNCRIMPRPGTEKVWASHSGFEIHNSLGYFKMENNYIEFCHDDGLHYSDYFLGGGFKKLNDNTLKILGLMYWQAADAVVVGDTYEFCNRDYSSTGFKAKLKSFKWTFVEGKGVAKHYVTAVFDRKIPDSLKPDTILFNTSSYGKGQFYIRNNTIKNGLTHGMEVAMPNGIIENNRIINTAYPAMRIHSVIRWTRWHMGHPPTNIIIRNNYIEDVNTALRPPADLFIGGGIDPQKDDYFPSPFHIVRDVLIEKNTIKTSRWQPLAIWSARNVIIRDNKLINPNRLPSKKNYGGTINLSNVENILITGNVCEDNGKALDHGIVGRKGTCNNVILYSNRGID
jgi:hypothetical protein